MNVEFYQKSPPRRDIKQHIFFAFMGVNCGGGDENCSNAEDVSRRERASWEGVRNGAWELQKNSLCHFF